MFKNRKPPTEAEVISSIERGELALPPLIFDLNRIERPQGSPWDILLEGTWQDQKAKFAVECKAQWTPKAFEDALRRIKDTPPPNGYLALLVMPYLSESHLQELERAGVSGVDLCGNGMIVVPGGFSVFRCGTKNRFTTYAPIKNIYRGNTSMVSRVFLETSTFGADEEIRKTINDLNLLVASWGKTPMAPGTVSKALKGLEEDLIIDRTQGGARLLQAEKLIDSLQEYYAPLRDASRVRLKVENGEKKLAQLIREQAEAAKLPIVATGLSSVTRYAAMQREEVLAVYCPQGAVLQERLSGKETGRFPNLEIIETEEQPLYFDARDEDGFLWASPLQTYLELMRGDKRDQETAAQVKALLLNRAGSAADR